MMTVPLRQLLHDLRQRILLIQDEASKVRVLPETEGYLSWVIESIENLRSKVDGLIETPDIEDPEYAKNFLRKYRQLARRVHSLVAVPLLVLTRFTDKDRFPTAVCKKIFDEIGYRKPPPLCVALASGYSTYPGFNVVMIPVNEPEHLLGLADLYHELAHIILFAEHIDEGFYSVVDDHYETEIERIKNEGAPLEYVARAKELQIRWRGWAKEFACDMIATYLVGSAYAWCNLRLCMNQSENMFDPSESHPCDDSRNEGICLMLEKPGISKGDDANEVREMWNRFAEAEGNIKPQDYEFSFPSRLLIGLVDFTYERCTELGLVPYIAQNSVVTDHIALSLNDAWSRLTFESSSYAEWEKQRVNELKQVLGCIP